MEYVILNVVFGSAYVDAMTEVRLSEWFRSRRAK